MRERQTAVFLPAGINAGQMSRFLIPLRFIHRPPGRSVLRPNDYPDAVRVAARYMLAHKKNETSHEMSRLNRLIQTAAKLLAERGENKLTVVQQAVSNLNRARQP